MAQNLVKIIIDNVALSFQVNHAIEIPNITGNYINSHFFTCQTKLGIYYAYLNIGCVVGMFFDWPDCFYSREMGLIGTCREISVRNLLL